MDLLAVFFWLCWTLFFGLIFMDRLLKGIKRFVVHFYFRGKAHFDVETDYNNREQLKNIEDLFQEQRSNTMLQINNLKKQVNSQVLENRQLLKELKQKIDELGGESE